MNLPKLVTIALVGTMLAGCAQPVLIKKNQPHVFQTVEKVFTKLNIAFENDQEEAIVKDNFYDFCYFLRFYKDAKKWDPFIALLLKGKSVELAVLEVYGKSIYHLGGEMISRTLKEKQSQQTQSKTVKHRYFSIHSDDGTALEKDWDHIIYLLDNYDRTIQERLLTDKKQKKQFKKSLAAMKDQTVMIYLLSTREAVKKTFGSPWSTAETNVGYGYEKPEERGTLYVSMAFKYSSLLVLNTVVHELTHLIHALSTIDSDAIQAIEKNDKKALTQKLEAITKVFQQLGSNVAFSEGLAEYMAANANLMQRYGIIGDIDEVIKVYCRKNNINIATFDVDSDLRSGNSDQRVLAYQMAHSFTRYCIHVYGMDSVLQLLETNGDQEDYLKLFNRSKEDLYRKWKRNVFDS